MQFTSSNFFALLATAFAAAPALAQQAVLNYDTMYNQNGSLGSTSCRIQGRETFGSIPSYPFITGAFFVTQFNDADCGTCYELSFTRRDGTITTEAFTIVNQAPSEPDDSFVASLAAVEALTGYNRDTFPGSVPITYRLVAPSRCGL